MTLQQLEYIVALDEERHFVRAAERCFVTQPTLSMQVHKLEEQLGVLIFDRKVQPLQPTLLGKEIILRARSVLREARQLRAIAAEAGEGMQGEFRIGVIPTLAPYLIPRFLQPFLAAFPELRLHIDELQTAQIFELLEKDQLDAGLMAGPVEIPQLNEYPVFREPFLLYGRADHPLMRTDTLDASALNPAEMWILNEGHCFRNQVLNVCEIRGRQAELRYRYESGSIETLKRMVRRSGGYTLIPELALEAADLRPEVAVRRFDAPEPLRAVVLVTHHSYSRRGFVENLQQVVRANLPAGLLEVEGGRAIPIA